MRFFTKFPYTNLNNLNLDWVLERLRAIEDYISGVSDSIEAAQTTADNAQTAAANAQTAADNAQTAAEAAQATINKEILYYENVAVNPATNAQIMRIPATGADSNITVDSVVLECSIDNRNAITSNISWVSYDGYIVLSGTCESSTLARLVLGNKNN